MGVQGVTPLNSGPACHPRVVSRFFPSPVLCLALLATAWGAAAGAAEPVATPADPDTIAQVELERARAELSAGQSSKAMKTLTGIYNLRGVSERYQAKAMTITADLSLRRNYLKSAKNAAERVVNLPGADQEDRDFCSEILRTLRRDHANLFR